MTKAKKPKCGTEYFISLSVGDWFYLYGDYRWCFVTKVVDDTIDYIITYDGIKKGHQTKSIHDLIGKAVLAPKWKKDDLANVYATNEVLSL